jgi:hypothetical protein
MSDEMHTKYKFLCVYSHIWKTVRFTEKCAKQKVKVKKAHRVVKRRGFHHFLNNRLTDGGEVVSPTLRPPFTPRVIPGSHFY